MASPTDAASLFGSIHEDITFKLTITDVKDELLRVASYTGKEELSRLFQYAITVATNPDADSIKSLEEALGRDATFTIEKDGKVARIVHGIVTRVVPDGTFIGKTRARVIIVLEPRMATLKFSGGFRIFQDMQMNEIVDAICEAEQIDRTWHVHGRPDKRLYCTQFNESDFDFIARLASEEGMHFFFIHDEKKTTLVFANEADGYEEVAKELEVSFNDAVGAVDDECVRSIQRSQSVRTGAFEHRDYNFLEPSKTLVARAETAGKETTANSHKREIRNYAGRFIDKDGPGKKLAQMRLDELRSDAFTLEGTARSLRFSVGHTFKLTGHRDEGFKRKLLLTSVKMQGQVQGALADGSGFRAGSDLVVFSAVPADIQIRPERKSRPMSRLQSARVVGPKDGDPYVDDYGRVKVQFFWDRDGKFDEKSSCWIRMMTPVAHQNEGFWQAHKVGSEVVVGFIDDDIDRPMILGAVYNTAQSQLYPLPAQVAKSVWRTGSVPGNAGYNEITQNNTAGSEELFMHAQKDRKTVVLHNHAETVGANQTSSIGANQTISVGANQTVSVGANRTLSVGANETTSIKAKRTETVGAAEEVTITGGRTHTITSNDDKLTVSAGNRNVDVALKDTHHAQNKEETIDQAFELKAGASIFLHMTGGDAEMKIEPGSAAITTQTKVSVWTPSGNITLAQNKIMLDAVDEIVLTCGSSSLSLKNDGTISLKGTKEVNASSASSSLSVTPAKAALNGPNTDVVSKAITTVGGALVKIG